MTSTIVRPAPSPRPTGSGTSSLVTGATAALWALGAGLLVTALPVLAVWATDPRSGSGAPAALRAAAQIWLVAHGASLHLPGGLFGLTPLGLCALPLGLLWRAGRQAARTLGLPPEAAPGQATAAAATRLVVALAGPYALGAALVATLAGGSGVRPAPASAFLHGLLIAVPGATAGVLRECGVVRPLVEKLPARVRGLTVGALTAVLALLLAGALLAAAGLLTHLPRAVRLATVGKPGLAGGVVLLLLGMLLVPNAAVFGLSWLAGPGFAMGVGTAVGPFGTHLGPVPAVPLLAALPAGPAPGWARIAVLLPVLAGAAAGAAVARRLAAGRLRAAAEAALIGPCAGLLAAALTAAAGGPLGGGRLRVVGPSPWQVGLAVAVEVAVGAAASSAVLVGRTRPR